MGGLVGLRMELPATVLSRPDREWNTAAGDNRNRRTRFFLEEEREAQRNSSMEQLSCSSLNDHLFAPQTSSKCRTKSVDAMSSSLREGVDGPRRNPGEMSRAPSQAWDQQIGVGSSSGGNNPLNTEQHSVEAASVPSRATPATLSSSIPPPPSQSLSPKCSDPSQNCSSPSQNYSSQSSNCSIQSPNCSGSSPNYSPSPNCSGLSPNCSSQPKTCSIPNPNNSSSIVGSNSNPLSNYNSGSTTDCGSSGLSSNCSSRPLPACTVSSNLCTTHTKTTASTWTSSSSSCAGCPNNNGTGASLRNSAGYPGRENTPTFPLITVTINPLEQNEVTFIPESGGHSPASHRRNSIGSASSLDDDDRLGPGPGLSCSVRRVSDISHINQLRREISGLSHLASEYYEVKKADPDNISLDSIHVRVLERCANKYQAPERSSMGSKCFVLLTTALTAVGITYGFWFKNFGPGKH